MNKYFHKGKEVSHGIARGGTLSEKLAECQRLKRSSMACLFRYFMINTWEAEWVEQNEWRGG